MMSSSRDVVVSTHTSWVCTSHTELREILITPQEDLITEAGLDPSASALCEPVRLERAEESSPCVITLLCRPDSGAVISSLQVASEARTIEVYSLTGDYCGTSRGEEDPRFQQSSGEDERPFYRSHLVLETPLASCDVKLLSLGGRSAVGIRQVVVGLRFRPGAEFQPGSDAGIDLHRVQAMMEEMGTTLSPGAQNLMEMVQFQQKNKADVLGGFLPLLMGGGALACLAKGAKVTGDVGSDGAPALPGHQAGMFCANQRGVLDAVAGGPGGNQSPVSPDLLPMLQSVCGQVTQLRLDALTSPEKKTNGEREDHMCFGGLEKVLEKVVEKRMHDLENRLKEHMDTRLDALQKRLELTLHQLALVTSTTNPQ
ncbi:ATPase PAAT [Ictalurus furcatus]|uniref:ATPase PAAT n=1 Tax=Ictalurus furcatus TaxID=66913 RepID=UPI00234FE312|nr:ATPase PAAT [Ictalurus furcatus]